MSLNRFFLIFAKLHFTENHNNKQFSIFFNPNICNQNCSKTKIDAFKIYKENF